VSRRRLVAVVIAVALAAAGAAPGSRPMTKRAYLAAVSAACRPYARQLARIPAPANITAYGDVVESISRAIPVLVRQEAAMRRVQPPPVLRGKVERMFELHEQSVARPRTTLAAANRRDAGAVATGFGRFTAARDRSQAFARQLGIHCS